RTSGPGCIVSVRHVRLFGQQACHKLRHLLARAGLILSFSQSLCEIRTLRTDVQGWLPTTELCGQCLLLQLLQERHTLGPPVAGSSHDGVASASTSEWRSAPGTAARRTSRSPLSASSRRTPAVFTPSPAAANAAAGASRDR